MQNTFSRAMVTGVWTSLATVLLGASSASAQFTSDNVTLLTHMDLATLSANSGNDSWGYVSPGGREYVLMGLNNKLTVVEVTTPTAPVIVGSISHSNSSWGDVKVYQDHCYVVNETGGGMDVIDLSNIDAASNRVTLVQRVTTGGLSSSHNVAINTDSGFLYLIGSNLNGGAPVVYSLADPDNPVEVGRWTSSGSAYHHDAQIVTYTSGPYAGREILFGFSEGRGVDILDVTNKSNIFLLSRTPYPAVNYCHQGWATADRRYLYVNDEGDEINNLVPTTRTLIFDIADLENPVLVNDYTTGLASIDHNLYVDGCMVYEANYSSGVRVLNISDSLNPVEVGYFDTYPENNATNYNGVWNVYPFFPSGTVIASDIDRGLFILDVSAAVAASDAIPGTLDFGFAAPLPDTVEGGTAPLVTFNVAGRCGTELDDSTVMFHYDLGSGFISVPLSPIAANTFEAQFPTIACSQSVAFYFSAQDSGGGTWTAPSGAPGATYSLLGVGAANVLFEDNFETDKGWTATDSGVSSGFWERGIPVNDSSWDYDPISDSDGSGQCYLTENAAGNTDIDGGSVQLVSPIIDMTGDEVWITYDYYLYLTVADGIDMLLVEINNNGGSGAWTEIARHDTNGGTSWRSHTITQTDLDNAGVVLNANMKIRFTANDTGTSSINEAGLDAFKVTSLACASVGDGDWDVDGDVDLLDYARMQACWGEVGVSAGCLPGDLTGDDTIDADDYTLFNGILAGPMP
jgi:choice-of-anchor B domain-containing protein